MLHEWLYALAEELCHDRDYLYRYFVVHFAGFLNQIYREASRVPEGSYRLPGVKSNRRAELRWSLARRLDYVGPNLLAVQWRLEEAGEARILEEGRERFDLSTGRRLPESA
jgi:hypothetical protein